MPLHAEAVSEFRFIPPCSPIPAKEVPAADGWLHEVKFDGYRVQAHKMGSKIVLFSCNGHDCRSVTSREGKARPPFRSPAACRNA